MTDQTIGLISGLAHLALSVILAVMTTYGSFRVLGRLMKQEDPVRALREGNTAMGVLLAGVLVACALIVKAVTEPAVSTIQVFLFGGLGPLDVAKIIAMIGGYILLAIVLANITVWLALRCFLWLTHDLDELAEIRANNLAVAITVGVTVAVMGLFLSDGLSSLMQALVPFPEFQPVEILGG
ncbi:MAG: hypothetical protein HKN12_01875 [Gemmatimonadetes bacterium]|nr:hypothetical protein [Gemmatimonadota bacterium]